MRLGSREIKKKRLIGMDCALNGLKEVIKKEINFKIHLVIAFIVIVVGLLLGLSTVEWAIIVLTIGYVLFAEMVNTTIERMMDFIMPDFNPVVGMIKDIAAGAVLLSALIAVIIGAIIFTPKIVQLIF